MAQLSAVLQATVANVILEMESANDQRPASSATGKFHRAPFIQTSFYKQQIRVISQWLCSIICKRHTTGSRAISSCVCADKPACFQGDFGRFPAVCLWRSRLDIFPWEVSPSSDVFVTQKRVLIRRPRGIFQLNLLPKYSSRIHNENTLRGDRYEAGNRFSAKPLCLPHHNQVDFVPEPNQKIKFKI